MSPRKKKGPHRVGRVESSASGDSTNSLRRRRLRRANDRRRSPDNRPATPDLSNVRPMPDTMDGLLARRRGTGNDSFLPYINRTSTPPQTAGIPEGMKSRDGEASSLTTYQASRNQSPSPSPLPRPPHSSPRRRRISRLNDSYPNKARQEIRLPKRAHGDISNLQASPLKSSPTPPSKRHVSGSKPSSRHVSSPQRSKTQRSYVRPLSRRARSPTASDDGSSSDSPVYSRPSSFLRRDPTYYRNAPKRTPQEPPSSRPRSPVSSPANSGRRRPALLAPTPSSSTKQATERRKISQAKPDGTKNTGPKTITPWRGAPYKKGKAPELDDWQPSPTLDPRELPLVKREAYESKKSSSKGEDTSKGEDKSKGEDTTKSVSSTTAAAAPQLPPRLPPLMVSCRFCRDLFDLRAEDPGDCPRIRREYKIQGRSLQLKKEKQKSDC